MTEQIDTAALRGLAEAQADARASLTEIGQGVGGLGVHHPEKFEAMMRWDEATENGHADTILTLLDRLEQAEADAKTTVEVSRNVINKLTARAERAEAAIERVRALHNEDSIMRGMCAECSVFGTDDNPPWSGVEFPCPTVAALDTGKEKRDE